MIRCNETAALDIPVKLARWLEAQGKAGHAEAAALLLDSRLDATDRTRQAIARIADRRYVLVFDNFESVMAVEVKAEAEAKNSSTSALTSTSSFPVADPNLAAFFDGLLAARWRGLCLFTGRYRWDALEEHLGRGAAVELHLPALTAHQAIMLMDNLPRLRREPIATKLAVYRKVGGHPKSIELLHGWLATGQITDLLNDPRLDGMLADQWASYFLDALLAQLSAAERDALTRLSIFDTALSDEELTYAEISPAWVARWLDLSLLQREGGAAYTVHTVVREYMTGRMATDERRRAHEWAAAYYGWPFVEMAREVAAERLKREAESWTGEDIESAARNGAVRFAVARTDEMVQTRAAMGRALAWRDHLFAAGAYDPAERYRHCRRTHPRPLGPARSRQGAIAGEHRHARGAESRRRTDEPRHPADRRGQAGRGADDL